MIFVMHPAGEMENFYKQGKLNKMLFRTEKIESTDAVADIVERDFRTAAVFRKYGIEYCCAGKKSIEHASLMAGVELDQLKADLETAARKLPVLKHQNFEDWSVDFMTSYIINIHHGFLKTAMPEAETIVRDYAEHHQKKYPYMLEVAELFTLLRKEIFKQMEIEELELFPYIKQVAHAFEKGGGYGRLLVKTFHKPLKEFSSQHYTIILDLLVRIRALTENYSWPQATCTNHRLSIRLMNDIDTDISQHLFLENELLIPLITQYEEALLRG